MMTEMFFSSNIWSQFSKIELFSLASLEEADEQAVVREQKYLLTNTSVDVEKYVTLHLVLNELVSELLN